MKETIDISSALFPPVKMSVLLKRKEKEKKREKKTLDFYKNLYSHSNLRSMVNHVCNTLKLSCFSHVSLLLDYAVITSTTVACGNLTIGPSP